MHYDVIIRKQAKKILQSLSRIDRNRIAEKIKRLGCDPDDPSLDIKRLHGRSDFRLRVGDWRVIFERDDEVKIIAIEKVKPRGDVYK